MKPLISIIMPVYNCQEYIEDSIRSICQQTYKNWELIIVNDCSQDETLDKISHISDERIHHVNMEKHAGLTSAFEEGYKLAKGEFIIRHDGDDISVPNRLEAQQAYLEKNPDAGMVSCLISCFTRDAVFSRQCIFVERIQNNYLNYDDIKRATLGGFIPILFPTLMIRKTFMDKVINSNKNLSFDDHMELLLELIQITSVEKIDAILYYYRRHANAYHIVNHIEYEQYMVSLLKNPATRDRIKYQDFYSNFSSLQDNKLNINNESQIRVLMLVDALNVGGTETHVLDIAKRMINMGIYVVVATSGGPMEPIFEAYGIKIIKIPFTSDYIFNKRKFGLIKFLKTIIDEEHINMIHCHLFASMQLASELYRMYHIPYVVTVHGLFYPNDVLYSSCIQASTIIAVSEPVKNLLDAKLGDRISERVVVIPNGVGTDLIKKSDMDMDFRKELNISSNARIISYCSRLDWNKTGAARVVLFSISRLIEQFHNLHVVIIGDGPGKDSIEKEAQIINQMANRKAIHVIGAKANVIPYFWRSTAVIGTARVALEAMMCKKPVIAVGNQGYVGIISSKNKDTQWQMYFGDHDALEKPNVSRLTKDIRYLLWNPGYCRTVGEWGRKWCETNFNSDKIAADIVQIYKKILNIELENKN